jgi:hypothetical protein
MNINRTGERGAADSSDRLDSFGIYQVARQLFEDFWNDSEISRFSQNRSSRREEALSSFIFEPRYLGCYEVLKSETIMQRVSALSRIIGGLIKTIQTIESRARRQP